MSDISASSEVTIQGAFGDPMKPTVQGLPVTYQVQANLVQWVSLDLRKHLELSLLMKLIYLTSSIGRRPMIPAPESRMRSDE